MVTCSALYRLEEKEEILRELLRLIAIMHNFFTPTIKLRGKVREGGKVRRLEDISTPYWRVVALADVPEGTKEKLKAIRSAIDLFELTKQIEKLEKELDKAYQTKVRRYNNG